MPLTPADVHNVAFSKPPIGKRGYNEDEVDAFLDLVENELARLIEENSDLRQRVQELDQELAEARKGGGAAPVYEAPKPEKKPEPAKPEPLRHRWRRPLRPEPRPRSITCARPRSWVWHRTPRTG